ncbi:hypothetical protein VTI74DRAFT_10432 [Chaetomium olivicolor]
MKLSPTLLAAGLLAATAHAIGPSSPAQPPRLKGKPTKMDAWRWPNPFTSAAYTSKKFVPSCTTAATFSAREFLLDDLSEEPPLGLLPYREALKQVFSTREYPGSWDGIDPHGYDRNLLMMEYKDVPLKVREWIEEQERSDGKGKGLFAVYEKHKDGDEEGVKGTVKVPALEESGEEWRKGDEGRVVVFAPGAVYEVAPLWVAAGSDCEDALLDLEKYSGELADGGVVAYPVNRTKPNRWLDKREMEFKVQAEVLKANEEADTEKIEKAEETKAEKAEETKSLEKDEL